MVGYEAFGSESPMTDTWFIGKKDKTDKAHNLIKEVDDMLRNLYRDECIHILVRQRFGPDAEKKLPKMAGSPAGDECKALGCLRCNNVIAEYQVLADLRWILTRIVDGDFHEVRNSWKRRMDRIAELPDLFYIENYIKY